MTEEPRISLERRLPPNDVNELVPMALFNDLWNVVSGIEERLVAQEQGVAILCNENSDVTSDVKNLAQRLACLSDANLPQLVESSLLLVELRRIADELDRLNVSIDAMTRYEDGDAMLMTRDH